MIDSKLMNLNWTNENRINMKSKEEIALMWIILIIAGLITTAIMPEILVFIILVYCAWGLYRHYSNKL